MISFQRLCVVAVGAALLVPLSCGSDDSASGVSDDGAIEVVASFYPLQFVVEHVGGDRVTVSNLTPAGAEPHDLELTGAATAGLQDAGLVVYLAGFSPALDDAIANVSSENAFDVAPAADLDLTGAEHDAEHDSEHDSDHEDENAAEDDAEDHPDGEAGSGMDPHFWLDPIRLASVADAVADRLTDIDPAGADTFEQNAAALRSQLQVLDDEFTTGLANCASKELVTSHAAFGYLAERYGFEQVGVSGLLPEEEPSPADLADVTEFVREHDVRTIYSETLVDPAVAETVASETGAATAVLDPIEGLGDDSEGSDYLEVMRSNLSNLRSGQGCT